MLRDVFTATASQKVLQFLAKYSDREFHEREIVRRIGIAAGSANRASNQLYDTGILKRRRESKMLFYSIDPSHPAVSELKKLVNILLLEPLVAELKSVASRIVLFGSCAQGTDTSRSDMDVFIVTNDPQGVGRAIETFQFPKGFEDTHIQAIVKTPLELLEAGNSERVFLSEVEQGVTLWQGNVDER